MPSSVSAHSQNNNSTNNYSFYSGLLGLTAHNCAELYVHSKILTDLYKKNGLHLAKNVLEANEVVYNCLEISGHGGNLFNYITDLAKNKNNNAETKKSYMATKFYMPLLALFNLYAATVQSITVKKYLQQDNKSIGSYVIIAHSIIDLLAHTGDFLYSSHKL